MKKFKLTTQINLIFTLVTVLIGLIFIFILEYSYQKERESININQLSRYFEEVFNGYKAGEFPSNNKKYHDKFNGHIIWERKSNGIIEFDLANIYPQNENNAENLVREIREKTPNLTLNHYFGKLRHEGREISYFVSTNSLKATDPIDFMVIAFTDNSYILSMENMSNTIVRIVFIILIIIGNLIILMWSRALADRITKLESQIKNLDDNNYSKEILITGNDEITDLARTVDNMRKTIKNNETTKQEMIHNVSHDFKTPIAVIKSYAEAISDGISDPNEAEVIIKQADALTLKVQQLLELNKLAYLESSDNFEEIKIKDVIINVVNNHKYQSNVKVFMDLDDSTLLGLKENFYVIFSNILENGFRYAKTKIVVTLKNKTISFYNDGEHIDQKYIDEGFKPYEKGDKGQFGLGMSIVQKTAEHFNLRLKVDNIDQGVIFILEPKQQKD
ncbi:HAMP domain-containing histidine kinase [Acholeplasma sp. OttesenSCG-928-E16]|nr:HAMP domain-containing histidine kinase [Acholeplasma sp. OttesenSCG-928-E16]